MINKLLMLLNSALGLDLPELNIWHMIFRTIVVYLLSLILFRLNRRVLAQPSSFDFVFIILYGSVISRAISGAEPFFPILGAAFGLAILHTFFSFITFYSPKFGALIKGGTVLLMQDGHILWDNMRKAQLTQRDLLSALRRNAQILNLEDVKIAILERNGQISVIPKPRTIDTIDVKVLDGVQIVKIEFKQ